MDNLRSCVLSWRAMIFVQKSWVGIQDFRWQRYQAFQHLGGLTISKAKTS